MKNLNYKINIAVQDFLNNCAYIFYRVLLKIFRRKGIFCEAIFSGTTMQIFCDGRVSCSCRDTSGIFNLGNVFHQSVFEVWHGKGYNDLRNLFKQTKIPNKICATCACMRLVNKENVKYDVVNFPDGIYFENTAMCNLNCFACKREAVLKTRAVFTIPKEKAIKILSEICDYQKSKPWILILGQGEPFLDSNLSFYVSFIKKRMPQMEVLTSTNAIPLDSESKIIEVINSGIDKITISIDGATERSYLKYQIKGDFKKAFSNMKKFIEIRNKMHLKKPLIIWQYILFRWNDSRKEMKLAQKMAREIGVDEFVFKTTMVPILCISFRSISFLLKHIFRFLSKKNSHFRNF